MSLILVITVSSKNESRYIDHWSFRNIKKTMRLSILPALPRVNPVYVCISNDYR